MTRRIAVSRNAMIGGAIGALIALAVGALLLANSFMARQVGDDAIRLGRAQDVLAANDLTVLALSQALLLSEDVLLGVADRDTARTALAEAHRRVDKLESASQELLVVGNQDPSLAAILKAATDHASSVVQHLDSDDVGAAGESLTTGLARFEAVRDRVTAVRNEAQASIDASSGITGQSGSTTAFLIALLIPALAIVGYRWIAQNQVRVAEVELDARLEAEQEITRSKDEFIANVSHELRTPLTSIFGLSELLLEEGLVDPEVSTDLLTVINKEAIELTRMIEDILVLARSEGNSLTFHPEVCSLIDEVAEYVASLPDSSNITFERSELTGWFDRPRFRHVLRNLISNAQRHGGDEIEIFGSISLDQVSLVIADNGDGIADADVARLFSAYFHQGEAPLTQGTLGMGLAAARELALGMNGDIRYDRTDGWTRFIVILPVRPADELPTPTTLSDVA